MGIFKGRIGLRRTDQYNYNFMNNNSVENIFLDWGKSRQQLPQNPEAMKARVLAGLNVSDAKTAGEPKRLPWMSFAFTAFALFAFVILYGQNAGVSNFTSQKTHVTLSPGFSSRSGSAASPLDEDGTAAISDSLAMPRQAVPPQAMEKSVTGLAFSNSDLYGGNRYPDTSGVPGSDNREFLKTDYSASIQTRQVQEMTQQIQTTVRGFDGRVDNASNSVDGGYVSFVIPASRLDAFKMEVKSIAGAKFYTESLSSQNMLSDKRSLEERQKQTNNTLSQLGLSRDQLIADHTKTVASLNSQLSTIARESAALKVEAVNTINYDRQLQIGARQEELQKQTKALNAGLANENTNFTNQLDSLNYQIQDAQGTLGQLNKQTGDLLDTVATVSGTISVSYISLWAVLGLYLPAYWIVYILLIAAVVAYYIHRRRFNLLNAISV